MSEPFSKEYERAMLLRVSWQATLVAFVVTALFLGTLYMFRGTLFRMAAEEYVRVSSENERVSGEQSLLSTDRAVTETVERVNPAVVSIVVSKDVPVLEQYLEEFNPFGGFFGDGFLFRVPGVREKGKEKREVGGGSGFLVSKEGLVVTNKHVVDDENAEYTVLLNDGKKVGAKVLAKDPSLDLAVLKLTEGDGYPFLEFGTSANLKLGQSVIAIGNALGEFRNSVSVGVVSGLARSLVAGDGMGGSEALEGVIQTDAAINPGNSGGPLLDLSGRVIGVNIAVAQGSENIGFALPSDAVKGAVESVAKEGRIVRPFIGVRYMMITPEFAKANKLSVDYGVLVSRGETREDLAVIPGSPADKAGIEENDIILSINGVKLEGDISLASVIRSKNVGDMVRLEIIHDGTKKTVEVLLEETKP